MRIVSAEKTYRVHAAMGVVGVVVAGGDVVVVRRWLNAVAVVIVVVAVAVASSLPPEME